MKLSESGLDKRITSETPPLEYDIVNIGFLTKEQKSILCIKYSRSNVDLIKTEIPLIKHPYSLNQHLTTHFLHEEETFSNKRIMGSGNSLYNELNSYIKLFRFDEAVGLNSEEAFKSFSEFGSRHARFKYLPTVVEDIDPTICLEDNLGYSNYFHKMNYEDLLPVYWKYKLQQPLGYIVSGSNFLSFNNNTIRTLSSDMIITEALSQQDNIFLTTSGLNKTYLVNQEHIMPVINKIDCCFFDYKKVLYTVSEIFSLEECFIPEKKKLD